MCTNIMCTKTCIEEVKKGNQFRRHQNDNHYLRSSHCAAEVGDRNRKLVVSGTSGIGPNGDSMGNVCSKTIKILVG